MSLSSPFQTASAGPFIFLAAAATSTLTLIVIVNRLRSEVDHLQEIVRKRREARKEKNISGRYEGLNVLRRIRGHIRMGEWIIFLQLLLVDFIFVRIGWSFFNEVPPLCDLVLIAGGFGTLGVGWTLFFIRTTWSEKMEKISNHAGLVNPFKGNQARSRGHD